MNDLLAKVSSYNIFNYLLPGVLFVVFAHTITHFSFYQENVLIAAFMYYFAGMVISRIGSLIVEPALKVVGFLKSSVYADFVHASSTDEKLETLSEANNSYRTICALFVSLLALKLFEILQSMYAPLRAGSIYWLSGVLLLLFLFSYRKQTSYITKRIDADLRR